MDRPVARLQLYCLIEAGHLLYLSFKKLLTGSACFPLARLAFSVKLALFSMLFLSILFWLLATPTRRLEAVERIDRDRFKRWQSASSDADKEHAVINIQTCWRSGCHTHDFHSCHILKPSALKRTSRTFLWDWTYFGFDLAWFICEGDQREPKHVCVGFSWLNAKGSKVLGVIYYRNAGPTGPSCRWVIVCVCYCTGYTLNTKILILL